MYYQYGKIAFLVQNFTLKSTKEVYFLLGHPVGIKPIKPKVPNQNYQKETETT